MSVKAVLSSLAVVAFLFQAEPALAGIQQPDTQAPPAEKEAGDDLVSHYLRQLYAGHYDAALASADKLDPGPANKPGQAIVAAMRGAALLGLKRKSEALKHFSKAEELAPNEPYPNLLQYDAGLATESPAISLAALDRMISRMPDVVRDLDTQSVAYLLSKVDDKQEAQNDDRRIALARLGLGGKTESGDYFSKVAIDALVKRGDVAGARDLLRYVDEPQIIENLLIQKRFSALWPDIEAMAGSNLAKVRASATASARLHYEEDPSDNERLQLLINALRHAGNLDEAIALRSKLPATSAAMSTADEKMGWAINNVALALHEAGRAEEADKLFAMLNEAPMPAENWRVSMKINRLELLVEDGKFADALPLIEPTAKVEGTSYAGQLVRRLRYCTFHGLGRIAEANALLPELMAHKQDAVGATVDGLLCAGRMEDAERLVLESLDDPDLQEELLRRLQVKLLTSDDPSVWTKGWLELRRRPAVAARFEQLARDLPEQFLP